jgi:hypothetical protein
VGLDPTGSDGTTGHCLAMRRIADLYPGRAKTDARDAFIIADAARSLPHTLRPVDVNDNALAELDVLVGFDDDLAGEATPAVQPHPRPAHRHPPRPRTRNRPEGHAPGRAGDPVPRRWPTGIRKAGRRQQARSWSTRS